MKKRNEKFNLFLNKRTRKVCEEATSLSFDAKRTRVFIKVNAQMMDDKFKAYVMSPTLIVFNDDIGYNAGKENCMFNMNIPGDPGDWTDDEDSYVVVCKKISEKENFYNKNTIYYKFIIKIYNYADVGKTELFNDEILLAKYFVDLDIDSGLPDLHHVSAIEMEDIKEIDAIKNNLHYAVGKAAYMYLKESGDID